MTDTLTLGLAQLNPTVGDIAGNPRRFARAARARADATFCCSELALTAIRPRTSSCARRIAATRRAVGSGGHTVSGAAVLVTTPWENGAIIMRSRCSRRADRRNPLSTSAQLRRSTNGCLPPARIEPIDFHGAVRLGVMICETCTGGGAPRPTTAPSADRAQRLAVRARSSIARRAGGGPRWRDGLALVYVNPVGGRDELVSRRFLRPRSRRAAVVRLPVGTSPRIVSGHAPPAAGPAQPVRSRRPDEPQNAPGTAVGLRDYVNKNRFPGACSGSRAARPALTTAAVVDALGADRVLEYFRLGSRARTARTMPTSSEAGHAARHDSDRRCRRRDERTLAPTFAGRERDITERTSERRTPAVDGVESSVRCC